MAIKKTQLYSIIWKGCDELRGGMDASQYKDYVLVVLFLKYISDKAKVDSDSLIELPEGCTFDDLVKAKNKSDIGETFNKILERMYAESLDRSSRVQGSPQRLPLVSQQPPLLHLATPKCAQVFRQTH